MVASNFLDKDIYNRTKTMEHNKFASRGGGKREEEKASKAQEGRGINSNIWYSKDKTESGEYVLSRPPKKLGGREADDGGTATKISLETSSTLESLKRDKVPNILRMKKENEHDIYEEFAWDIGVAISRLQFMTGHQIRERSTEMTVDKAYHKTP